MTNPTQLIEQLVKALERIHLWADSQADAQSKGGHATFDLMHLREEREALIPALTAARAHLEQPTEPAPSTAGELTLEQITRIYDRYGGDMVNCTRAIERELAAARSQPTTEESSVVAGAQPVREPLTEAGIDDAAVDAFAIAMKDKLRLAREKGRSGWQSCSELELSAMLHEHVEKGDPRDVANFCMFLHSKGHGITKKGTV